MRFLILVLLLATFSCKQKEQSVQSPNPQKAQISQVITPEVPNASSMSPEEILVQAQLDAYNKRDIQAFMKCYAEDVKVYGYPDHFTYEGKKKMYNLYSKIFKTKPKLNAVLLKRIAHKDVVIDHEFVTISDDNKFFAIAIYKIKNGKIAEVRFVQ